MDSGQRGALTGKRHVGPTGLIDSIDGAMVIPCHDRWRCYMQTVTVLMKYQMVIPKKHKRRFEAAAWSENESH